MEGSATVQSHTDSVAAALALVPTDGNFEVLTAAYMSLGWLKSEAEIGIQKKRLIDAMEEDAIRISDRQGLIGG